MTKFRESHVGAVMMGHTHRYSVSQGSWYNIIPNSKGGVSSMVILPQGYLADSGSTRNIEEDMITDCNIGTEPVIAVCDGFIDRFDDAGNREEFDIAIMFLVKTKKYVLMFQECMDVEQVIDYEPSVAETFAFGKSEFVYTDGQNVECCAICGDEADAPLWGINPCTCIEADVAVEQEWDISKWSKEAQETPLGTTISRQLPCGFCSIVVGCRMDSCPFSIDGVTFIAIATHDVDEEEGRDYTIGEFVTVEREDADTYKVTNLSLGGHWFMVDTLEFYKLFEPTDKEVI